jgi:dienelactone hydrolase
VVGLNQNIRNQAVRMAKAGYVAFALDMYGKGKVATHAQDAQTFAPKRRRTRLYPRPRFHDAVELLKQDPHVDATKIAAVGYCYGGGVVLDRARAGDPDLDAVVSFHGMLATQTPPRRARVKARVLAAAGEAVRSSPPRRSRLQAGDDGGGRELQGRQLSGREARLHESRSRHVRNGADRVQPGGGQESRGPRC